MSDDAFYVRRGHRHPFSILPELLIHDPRVSDRAFRLWALLDRYAGATREGWPKRETLAEKRGCSLDTIDRGIRELEATGWLRVERNRGRGKPSIYVLLNPHEDDAEKAADVRPQGSGRGRTSAARRSRTSAAPHMNETQLNENPPSPPEGGDWQPVKVGRKVVTSAERDLTDAILAEFNRQAGTSYRGAVDHHRMIVGRIREAPELSQPEHARIIRAAFADAWWTGTPGPEVIYGKGSVFERAQETARRMRHVPAALSDDEVQKRREAAAAAEAVQRERDLDEWYRQNPDVPDPRKVSR